MSATWQEFKSLVRNRMQRYYGPDMLMLIYGKIQSIEPGGFVDAFKKHKVQLGNLYSLLRWSFVYGQLSPKQALRFSENEFAALYNGMLELGQRDIPKSLSPDARINALLREAIRNQQLLQIDPLKVFVVFATIITKYCDKEQTNRLGLEMGFSSIDEFLFAHYSLTALAVLENAYVRDLDYFKTVKDLTGIQTYVSQFIPNLSEYQRKVFEAHEAVKKEDAIWKEIGDMSWFVWNPFLRIDNKIHALSLIGLAHYSGYGITAILSAKHKWFYEKTFSDGFHNFVFAQLSSNGKRITPESGMKDVIPGVSKQPDAFISNSERAIFIEFKSNKAPRYSFESFQQENIQSSVKSSIHKGMIQIFTAMKRFKELNPDVMVAGLVVTMHEYHSGIPSAFAQEVLAPDELQEYSQEIHSFGIASILDFLPLCQLIESDFIEEIFRRVGEKNFYQFANKKWAISEIPELSSAVDNLTKLAEERIQSG